MGLHYGVERLDWHTFCSNKNNIRRFHIRTNQVVPCQTTVHTVDVLRWLRFSCLPDNFLLDWSIVGDALLLLVSLESVLCTNRIALCSPHMQHLGLQGSRGGFAD
jgi:hypothetical protein